MAEKPTVDEALRFCENSKICDPYVLLEVLSEEVKLLRRRADKAEEFIIAVAPRTAIAALRGEYDAEL